MLSLSTILSPAKARKKRIGRGPGSGNGKTSGRGVKGQKSRSGFVSKLGFEGGQMPLHRRLPKRGFSRLADKKDRTCVLNVCKLIPCYESGELVSVQSLIDKGFVKSSLQKIKVIGKVPVGKKILISEDILVSAGLRTYRKL
ncbi:MAG: 50S ribosomal protein L15 [Acidobacteriota bacterium]